jgi:hypothetical protein
MGVRIDVFLQKSFSQIEKAQPHAERPTPPAHPDDLR